MADHDPWVCFKCGEERPMVAHGNEFRTMPHACSKVSPAPTPLYSSFPLPQETPNGESESGSAEDHEVYDPDFAV